MQALVETTLRCAGTRQVVRALRLLLCTGGIGIPPRQYAWQKNLSALHITPAEVNVVARPALLERAYWTSTIDTPQAFASLKRQSGTHRA